MRHRDAMGVLVCRQIHRRVGVEEAARLQGEARIFDRHHREILRLADMGQAEAVPEDEVLIVDRPVLRRIARQPVASRVLVRIVAPGIALLRRITGDPDMLRREAGACPHRAALLGEQQRARLDDELVSRRLARRHSPGWGSSPSRKRPVRGIGLAAGLLLARENAARDVEDIAIRIVLAQRARPEFVLGDAVLLAVDHHMQANIEDVLVGRSAEIFRHHAAKG